MPAMCRYIRLTCRQPTRLSHKEHAMNPSYGIFDRDDEVPKATPSFSPSTIAPGYTGRVPMNYRDKLKARQRHNNATSDLCMQRLDTFCTMCGVNMGGVESTARKCDDCKRDKRKSSVLKYCRFCGVEMLKEHFMATPGASVKGWAALASHKECQVKRAEVYDQARRDAKGA